MFQDIFSNGIIRLYHISITDEKKHGILPVDKIRGLVIIKVIEQLTFEAVGSLRYLISLKESRLAAALSGFFHIIVYLRNERMATIRAA